MSNLENPITKFYQLNNTILEHVDNATYLGILLHKSLHFSDHITITANKCNSPLGFIRRNLRKCPTQLKQTAYFRLVRSTAEYAATIWDPHTNKNKYALEKIQNRAIRCMCGVGPGQQASITEMRAKLKWPTLEARRHDQRLALMYKVAHVLVAVTPDDLGIENACWWAYSTHPSAQI